MKAVSNIRPINNLPAYRLEAVADPIVWGLFSEHVFFEFFRLWEVDVSSPFVYTPQIRRSEAVAGGHTRRRFRRRKFSSLARIGEF